jgi:hypothetical protein
MDDDPIKHDMSYSGQADNSGVYGQRVALWPHVRPQMRRSNIYLDCFSLERLDIVSYSIPIFRRYI